MSQTRKGQMDMLHGPLAFKIFLFALPLAASGILQQMFNAADVAVVGRFAGEDALAAVGANTFIVNIFINSFTGLSLGANVVLAQFIGQNKKELISKAVHTAIAFGMLFGLFLMVLGQLLAKPLLLATGAPENVLGAAMVYLRIYFVAMPFMAVFNFGSAILRSVGDTKRPTLCLIVTGILNLILNLIFVIVFKMGVAGVALATTIANVVSMIMVMWMLMQEESEIRLQIRKLSVDIFSLKRILYLGTPAALQSMVFSLSNICIQAGVNSFGTYAIAGNAAALNFEMFNFFFVTAMNQAAVTFMGQNYAAGKRDRCRKIFWICMIEALVGICSLILLFFTFQNFFIALFTTDPQVMAFAKIRMYIVVITHFMIVSYEITGSILRGMGRSLLPALITVGGCVCFRLLWINTVFRVWHSLQALFIVYPASWVVTGTAMITAYVIVRRKNLLD